jgi:hypothetical protein
LAHYGGPESEAGRHRGDEVVRPAGPQNTSGLQRPKGLQPLAALGTSVVFLLQVGHHVECVRSGQLGRGDAVEGDAGCAGKALSKNLCGLAGLGGGEDVMRPDSKSAPLGCQFGNFIADSSASYLGSPRNGSASGETRAESISVECSRTASSNQSRAWGLSPSPR